MHPKRFILTAAVLFAVISALSPNALGLITILDWNSNTGLNPSIVAPDIDTVYIAYQDGTTSSLKFASSASGGNMWDISTIDAVQTGYNPSLAYVAPSTLLISYHGGNVTNTLKLAKSVDNGNSWDITEVDPSRPVLSYNPVKSVGQSNFFIAYFDDASDDLRLAKSDDGGLNWNLAAVDTNGSTGWYASVDTLNATTVGISYHQSSPTYDLKFAQSTDGGATWSVSTIDVAGNVGSYTSLAMVEGRYSISYFDATNGNLKIALSSDGGLSWTTAALDASAADVGRDSSIHMFDSSTIYVTYYDNTVGDIRLARSFDGGSSWNISIVDADGNNGWYTSLAAVDMDTIFTSYYNANNGDLRFASSYNGGRLWGESRIPVQLLPGWNSFALPVIPEQALTAQSFIETVNSNGGNSEIIMGFDEAIQGWGPFHFLGDIGPGFLLEPGEGYFLHTESPATLHVIGEPVNITNMTLSTGYSVFSVPNTANATDLINIASANGGNCSTLFGFDAATQSWSPFYFAGDADGFVLVPGLAYVTHCETGAEVVMG